MSFFASAVIDLSPLAAGAASLAPGAGIDNPAGEGDELAVVTGGGPDGPAGGTPGAADIFRRHRCFG